MASGDDALLHSWFTCHERCKALPQPASLPADTATRAVSHRDNGGGIYPEARRRYRRQQCGELRERWERVTLFAAFSTQSIRYRRSRRGAFHCRWRW
ncbi:MAG: hypothetical protein OHK0015_39610 [Chloroflexi bacterium OHK40]